MPIQRIAGTLPIKGQGTISLQVIDNEGEVVNIEMQVYYIPELHTKLFSPQAYFCKFNDELELIIKCNSASMQLVGCEGEGKMHEIMFMYNQQNMFTNDACILQCTVNSKRTGTYCMSNLKNTIRTWWQCRWWFYSGISSWDMLALDWWCDWKRMATEQEELTWHMLKAKPSSAEPATWWENSQRWQIHWNMLKTRIWVSWGKMCCNQDN